MLLPQMATIGPLLNGNSRCFPWDADTPCPVSLAATVTKATVLFLMLRLCEAQQPEAQRTSRANIAPNLDPPPRYGMVCLIAPNGLRQARRAPDSGKTKAQPGV